MLKVEKAKNLDVEEAEGVCLFDERGRLLMTFWWAPPTEIEHPFEPGKMLVHQAHATKEDALAVIPQRMSEMGFGNETDEVLSQVKKLVK